MALCIVVMILVIAVDQLTKYLVASTMYVGETIPVWQNVFHITYVQNKGAAFGLLSNNRWIFMVLSVAAIVILFYYLIRKKPKSKLLRICLSLVVGGGIGNMIDRIFNQYVVDFIDVRAINFFVFNIADSCVTIGCVLLIIYILVTDIRASKKKKELAGNDDTSNDK